jgi:hypothetical protein
MYNRVENKKVIQRSARSLCYVVLTVNRFEAQLRKIQQFCHDNVLCMSLSSQKKIRTSAGFEYDLLYYGSVSYH